ncbi:MAG: UDP-glucose 4-epimerase GalE [Acidobacteria bacterium]|nr:UDP-glucose 4-epimerase GalE [Acidobacteriota bacterium]
MPHDPYVLVTGGAGYIGSHTVELLLRRGYRPVVFDNFSTGHRALLLNDDWIQGDLRELESIRGALQKYPFQSVLHFASHCYVGESMDDPPKYFFDNLTQALNLLRAMLEFRIPHFVLSSTCSVYGHPQQVPIPETHPVAPTNPYGESKRMIERILEWYDRADRIRFVSLRYFNAAGAHPSGRLGELHDPEPHLIPRVLQVAAGIRPFVEIHGEDYPTADGTCIRDYVHVVDLAEAHLLALQRLQRTGQTGIFNLGTGKGYSVKEVIRAAQKITGREIPCRSGLRRPGDPSDLVADPTRAERDLDWVPRHSTLESILETAWNFLKVPRRRQEREG